MKFSLTFILSLIIALISSCTSIPNDLKNDLDTKDSINNSFISNQLNKTNNIELELIGFEKFDHIAEE